MIYGHVISQWLSHFKSTRCIHVRSKTDLFCWKAESVFVCGKNKTVLSTFLGLTSKQITLLIYDLQLKDWINTYYMLKGHPNVQMKYNVQMKRWHEIPRIQTWARYVSKANVDYIISGQGIGISTLYHSTTTPRDILILSPESESIVIDYWEILDISFLIFYLLYIKNGYWVINEFSTHLQCCQPDSKHRREIAHKIKICNKTLVKKPSKCKNITSVKMDLFHFCSQIVKKMLPIFGPWYLSS